MIKGGPRIVTDGLVLCLDAHDAKSYAGEPVTNLVSSSAIDFSTMSGYTDLSVSRVIDDESPSGYACEMYESAEANSAARSRFGDSTNIPTSGGGFVSIWVKQVAGTANIRPYVYCGHAWDLMVPLDGGSQYITNKYRPFGVAVTFNTNSSGPNPGFNMTRDGTSVANVDKVRWIKPHVTNLTYNTPFANLSRSDTNGWVDRSGNSNSGTLVNGTDTGVSHYRDGQVIMPVSASYLRFDGSDDYVSTSFGSGRDVYSNPISFVAWVKASVGTNNKMWLDHGSNGTNQRLYSALITADNPSAFGIQGSAWSLPSSADSSKWYHQAIVMDSGTARAYYDGIAAGTKSYTSYTLPGNTIVGGRSTYYWNGQIACFSVYDKALTAAEVLQNYNATKGRFS